MTLVDVSSQLAGNTRLWRYVSLDKLVDLTFHPATLLCAALIFLEG